MGTFETFDHTADLGLTITGADLDDLFITAARGLMAVVVANPDEIRIDADPTDPGETVDLRAGAADELLALWLNELIYRVETRHRLYARFDISVTDSGRSLRGAIRGEPMDRDRHVLDHEVKAATRHDLTLERRDDGTWAARVIVDI
jgi:SHS2 domain-containing protein